MAGVHISDFRQPIRLHLVQGISGALDRASSAGAAYYRGSVPVRTGRLKRSARRLGSPSQLVRAWGSDPSAPHSRFVELGTRKTAARPRLRESVQVAGQSLLKELK